MKQVTDIGNDTQLFLDHRLCSERENIHLIMHQPVRSGEILLEPNMEEQENGLKIGSYSSVLQENNLTRIWYFINSRDDKSRRRLCYAESTDGLHFNRPSLAAAGNSALEPANAVLDDPVQGGCVWIDPLAPPQHRYRTQAKWGPPAKFTGMGSTLHFYASSDGFNWQETHYLHLGDCDTQTVVFHDERYGRYVMYTREWVRFEDRNLSHRKVRRLESDDLVQWDQEKIVWEADAEDLARWQTSVGKPPVDYYGACVFKYPQAGDFYIMLAQPFWHWQDRPEEEKWGYSPDPENLDRRVVHLGPSVIDTRLAFSHDGIAFNHSVDRGAFLGVGPDGCFDSRAVWIMPNPVIRDNDIWFYYVGSNRDHDGFVDSTADRQRSGIGRAVLRRDGFVSAETDRQGGWLITPALNFKPGQLELNVAASAGGAVRVEILDERKKPITAFSGDNSPWLCGDSVNLPVPFRGNQVAQLSGRPVHLKFYLQEAKLYSFRFK